MNEKKSIKTFEYRSFVHGSMSFMYITVELNQNQCYKGACVLQKNELVICYFHGFVNVLTVYCESNIKVYAWIM